jgi:hypothetical protein
MISKYFELLLIMVESVMNRFQTALNFQYSFFQVHKLVLKFTFISLLYHFKYHFLIVDVFQVFYLNIYAENIQAITYKNLLDLLNRYFIF